MSLDMTVGAREAALDSTNDEIEAQTASARPVWLADLMMTERPRSASHCVQRLGCCCSCADASNHSLTSARRESDANWRRHRINCDRDARHHQQPRADKPAEIAECKKECALAAVEVPAGDFA